MGAGNMFAIVACISVKWHFVREFYSARILKP